MSAPKPWKRRTLIALGFVLFLVATVAGITWWKFFKEGEQHFADETEQFKYGSLGGELLAGIPYPIFMILPRVFPDLIDGYGGYGAFGIAWEEGERLPIGLSIKRRGFERVTVNCALCHTTSYRLSPRENPRFAVGGPGHTVDVQALLRFLFAAANDRRFSSSRLLPEMALHFKMDWIDVALYKFAIIPATRKALLIAEGEMAWMEDRPDWGPGRDDAFNLPKFVLTQMAADDSVGNTDFPALWMMGQRDGQLVHAGGEATTVASVIATSALGAGSFPGTAFDERNDWIEAYMRDLTPPPYPGGIDPARATEGAKVFARACASCHAPDGDRVGTAIPLVEIGTDPEHVRAWQQPHADRMNRLTAALGIDEAPLQGAKGYVARPLTGVWLLAPYLHNGSVPTLDDLLSPPGERPKVFYRGYDLVDLDKVGFVSSGPEAAETGFRFDTAEKGNGNSGHEWGTTLAPDEKSALIEYLKGL
ncbi:MAG: c-type cytochrome [Alphaproteobacteria bacterium]